MSLKSKLFTYVGTAFFFLHFIKNISIPYFVVSQYDINKIAEYVANNGALHEDGSNRITLSKDSLEVTLIKEGCIHFGKKIDEIIIHKKNSIFVDCGVDGFDNIHVDTFHDEYTDYSTDPRLDYSLRISASARFKTRSLIEDTIETFNIK